MAELRGRFVLLDFWTFCCVNCLHVLEELRPVEEKYAEELVIVGVHSPKFVHEADPDALVAAVERYGVHHPVLDDPELITWQAYTARAWPTLVLVDPEGYVVAQYAGEGHAHAIAALLAELVEEHRAKGTLQPGDLLTSRRGGAERAALPGRRRCVGERPRARRRCRPRPGGGARGDGGEVRRWGGFKEPNGLCVWAPRPTSPTRSTTSSRGSTWGPAT